MAGKSRHLAITKRFLGYKGNPAIHTLLDIKPITYHKLTHNPDYIELIIKPQFGERGEIEAWLHLLVDWGIYEENPSNPLTKREARR